VSQLDVGRTLLDLAGLAHADFPGRSLLVEPEVARAPRFALSAHAKSASIELGRWFLVLHLRTHVYSDHLPPRQLHEVELFDLENDRACETNVVDAHPDETRRLRALLVEWLVSARAEGWAVPGATQTAEAMAELRELGYTDFGSASLTNDWFDPGCQCARCAKYE
jgi:arylsulfatase A-like enzyme